MLAFELDLVAWCLDCSSKLPKRRHACALLRLQDSRGEEPCIRLAKLRSQAMSTSYRCLVISLSTVLAGCLVLLGITAVKAWGWSPALMGSLAALFAAPLLAASFAIRPAWHRPILLLGVVVFMLCSLPVVACIAALSSAGELGMSALWAHRGIDPKALGVLLILCAASIGVLCAMKSWHSRERAHAVDPLSKA